MNYEGVLKTNNDGELQIYNKMQFDQFFMDHANGDFVFKVEKIKRSTGRLDAYYMAEVLPKSIEGFRRLGMNFNKEMAMDKLRQFCPIMTETEIHEGKTVHTLREWDELNDFEKARCIDETIIFAAENLDTIIENPH